MNNTKLYDRILDDAEELTEDMIKKDAVKYPKEHKGYILATTIAKLGYEAGFKAGRKKALQEGSKEKITASAILASSCMQLVGIACEAVTQKGAR